VKYEDLFILDWPFPTIENFKLIHPDEMFGTVETDA
jgi:hypothetical protein